MEANTYYGMDYNPFTKAIKSDRLFESNDYRQMMNRMDFIIRSRGIGVFLSSPGMGKTTALRAKLDSLSPNRYKVIYICMTTVTAIDFYRILNDQLGLEESSQKSRLVRQIKEELKRIVDENRMEIIIAIDEAQYLKRDILKEFIMLMNFDYDSKDYCTLLLLGQNDFLRLLRYKNLEAFTQRINMNYTFTGMSEKETKEYVQNRLELVNCPKDLFTEESYHTLFTVANGSIRTLNLLVSKSLIVGFRREAKHIDTNIIMAASEELINV